MVPRNYTLWLSLILKMLKVIQQFHEGPIGGHQGVLRTYNRMKYYVKFKNMFTKIKKFIKLCDLCQKKKKTNYIEKLNFLCV